MKLIVKINNCPNCSSKEVRKYEFGQYFCSNCNTWFTKKDFKKAEKVEA